MNLRPTPYIYILFLISAFSVMQAQKFELQIEPAKSDEANIIRQLAYQKKHLSENSLRHELDSVFRKLEIRGYLNTSLDTLIKNDSIYTAQIYTGHKLESIKIYYGHIDPSILNEKELKPISKNTSSSYFVISFDRISSAMQYLADYFEQQGNSFTSVRLGQIELVDREAVAQLEIRGKRKRTIDKVVIKGYENFPKSFVRHELQLKRGAVFNKEKLQMASQAINNLPFAEERKAPEVLFTEDSTLVYLYLKKKRSNQFDGIIGFASKEASSGLEFNGYLDLAVNNLFNSGETIAIYWKNNGNDRQRFYLEAELPYLFNLPLVPAVNFELYRQDSTYNNVSTLINLGYSLGARGKLSASLRTENSNDLTKGAASGIQSYENIFYGITYDYTRMTTDNLFPVRFQIGINAMLGSRKSKSLRTEQSRFGIQASYLYPINSKNYIFLQNQSAYLNSDNYLTNELFRIGGVYNMRGVNEESIFASAYTIFNLEYRFRPNVSSYFYTITDFSYTENKADDQNANVISLGLGYGFTTKAGVLNLSYAIGKFDDTPFAFDNSKVHIKIISNF